MSCRSPPPASSHHLFSPPSSSPLTALPSADLSDSEEKCREKDKDIALWFFRRSENSHRQQRVVRQTVPGTGGGRLKLLRSDKVDYGRDSGYKVGECYPNKFRSGRGFFSVLLLPTTETWDDSWLLPFVNSRGHGSSTLWHSPRVSPQAMKWLSNIKELHHQEATFKSHSVRQTIKLKHYFLGIVLCHYHMIWSSCAE